MKKRHHEETHSELFHFLVIYLNKTKICYSIVNCLITIYESKAAEESFSEFNNLLSEFFI